MKKASLQERKDTTSPKKKYSAPHLACYGDVTQLTRGVGGHGTDGGKAGQSRVLMCWIAEALYGIDDPRTRLVRAWLTASYERRDPLARVVVPLYSRFGVAVGGMMSRYPALQTLFRPLFDWAVKRAHREYSGRAVLLQG
jgi:hypothetical protein